MEKNHLYNGSWSGWSEAPVCTGWSSNKTAEAKKSLLSVHTVPRPDNPTADPVDLAMNELVLTPLLPPPRLLIRDIHKNHATQMQSLIKPMQDICSTFSPPLVEKMLSTSGRLSDWYVRRLARAFEELDKKIAVLHTDVAPECVASIVQVQLRSVVEYLLSSAKNLTMPDGANEFSTMAAYRFLKNECSFQIGSVFLGWWKKHASRVMTHLTYYTDQLAAGNDVDEGVYTHGIRTYLPYSLLSTTHVTKLDPRRVPPSPLEMEEPFVMTWPEISPSRMWTEPNVPRLPVKMVHGGFSWIEDYHRLLNQKHINQEKKEHVPTKLQKKGTTTVVAVNPDKKVIETSTNKRKVSSTEGVVGSTAKTRKSTPGSTPNNPKVTCPVCGLVLNKSSLQKHRKNSQSCAKVALSSQNLARN